MGTSCFLTWFPLRTKSVRLPWAPGPAFRNSPSLASAVGSERTLGPLGSAVPRFFRRSRAGTAYTGPRFGLAFAVRTLAEAAVAFFAPAVRTAFVMRLTAPSPASPAFSVLTVTGMGFKSSVDS